MDNIYINPNGLAGNYQRSSGPEYDKLRSLVSQELLNLKDSENGKNIVAGVWKWEQALELFLPSDRVGDLIISNTGTYSFVEDMTSTLEILRSSYKGGYKQAILNSHPGLLTPFVIMGPGIKKNHSIERTIDHAEQFHLINYLMTNTDNSEKNTLRREVVR